MIEFRWIEGCYRGQLSVEQAYIGLNNYPASIYTKQFYKSRIDMAKIDIQKLREKFPTAIITTDLVVKDSKPENEIEDDEEIYPVSPIEEDESGSGFYVGDIYHNGCYIIFNGNVFYSINRAYIQVYHNGQHDPAKLCNELVDLLPVVENTPIKSTSVRLIAYSQGYFSVTTKIEKTIVDLKENYNDDFLQISENITNFLNSRKSGLIVLHGEKGTGKTNYIRHLITTIPKQYYIVTPAIADNLASPDFLTFMIEHKNSIFILEDCEKILMKRGELTGFNNAISNILNMSDGLMSDIFNVKFICTFNADIDQIDEALLRKGRCYANYEFHELSADKTKVLLNKQNITLDEYKPMTLADIYNYEEGPEQPTTKKRKIGF